MSEKSIDTYEPPSPTERHKSLPDTTKMPDVTIQKLPLIFQSAAFLESADALQSMSGVPKEGLMALIHRESNGDSRAKLGGIVGASRGLMQVIDRFVYGNMMIRDGRGQGLRVYKSLLGELGNEQIDKIGAQNPELAKIIIQLKGSAEKGDQKAFERSVIELQVLESRSSMQGNGLPNMFVGSLHLGLKMKEAGMAIISNKPEVQKKREQILSTLDRLTPESINTLLIPKGYKGVDGSTLSELVQKIKNDPDLQKKFLGFYAYNGNSSKEKDNIPHAIKYAISILVSSDQLGNRFPKNNTIDAK